MATPTEVVALTMKRANELLDDLERGLKLRGMNDAMINIMWLAIADAAQRRVK